MAIVGIDTDEYNQLVWILQPNYGTWFGDEGLVYMKAMDKSGLCEMNDHVTRVQF